MKETRGGMLRPGLRDDCCIVTDEFAEMAAHLRLSHFGRIVGKINCRIDLERITNPFLLGVLGFLARSIALID